MQCCRLSTRKRQVSAPGHEAGRASLDTVLGSSRTALRARADSIVPALLFLRLFCFIVSSAQVQHSTRIGSSQSESIFRLGQSDSFQSSASDGSRQPSLVPFKSRTSKTSTLLYFSLLFVPFLGRPRDRRWASVSSLRILLMASRGIAVPPTPLKAREKTDVESLPARNFQPSTFNVQLSTIRVISASRRPLRNPFG
jgi:hypothetical protein